MSRARILIVDDDGMILGAFRRLLTADGYEVETAADIKTARNKLTLREFDIMIVDVVLRPGENGIEFIRELRYAGCTRPIVVMSGYVGPTDFIAEVVCEELGCAFLSKPLGRHDLKMAVAELLADLPRLALSK